MTALDQAFIKAFGQQGRFPAASPSRKVVPLSEHLASADAENAMPQPPAPIVEPASSSGSLSDEVLRPRKPIATISPVAVEEDVAAVPLKRPPSDVLAAIAGTQPVAPPNAQVIRAKPATPITPTLHAATSTVNNGFAPWNAATVDSQATTVVMPQWSGNAAWATESPAEPLCEAAPASIRWPEPSAATAEQRESAAARRHEKHASSEANERRDLPPSPAVLSMTDAIKPRAVAHFQPAWQVDRFTWPKVCRRLIAKASEELDRLVETLVSVHDDGQKVLGMAGCRRGEGATTMLLCAARRLGERGIRVALVDADLNRPRLAKRLGVQPQFGWNEATDSEAWSLEQAVVEATNNNVALLPIRDTSLDRHRLDGDDSSLAEHLHTLRDHYDLVLVDLGPLENLAWNNNAPAWTRGGIVDSILLVHNERVTSEEDLAEVERHLSDADIAITGLIENFAPID